MSARRVKVGDPEDGLPELPEVECQKRAVNRRLPRSPFRGLDGPLEIKVEGPKTLERRLRGHRLLPLERRGKYLLLPFGEALPEATILLHLGMTGGLHILRDGEVKPRHSRLAMRFEDDSCLVLSDPRRFAVLVTGEREKKRRLEKVGPDALDIRLSDFRERLARHKAPVKAVLLDQSVIAGVGNIYAQEALFDSRVGPLKKACDLSDDEASGLLQEVKKVLKRAISSMDGAGKRRRRFRRRVYGRAGEPCTRCRSLLVSIPISGRTTVFCPRCQGER